MILFYTFFHSLRFIFYDITSFEICFFGFVSIRFFEKAHVSRNL